MSTVHYRAYLVVCLALAGCGARDPLPGSAAVPDDGGALGAQFGRSCTPNPWFPLDIVITGTAGCNAWHTSAPALLIQFSPAAVATLHAGGSVEVGEALDDGGNAWRTVDLTTPALHVTSGTLSIETYAEGSSMTGHYDMTYDDGSTEHAAFDAVWCELPEGCTG